MNNLSNNIVEYVLNYFLDYENEISILKQIYNYNFSIKSHIIYHYNNKDICQILIFLDNELIKTKEYYENENGKLRFNYIYENGIN